MCLLRIITWLLFRFWIGILPWVTSFSRYLWRCYSMCPHHRGMQVTINHPTILCGCWNRTAEYTGFKFSLLFCTRYCLVKYFKYKKIYYTSTKLQCKTIHFILLDIFSISTTLLPLVTPFKHWSELPLTQ